METLGDAASIWNSRTAACRGCYEKTESSAQKEGFPVIAVAGNEIRKRSKKIALLPAFGADPETPKRNLTREKSF